MPERPDLEVVPGAAGDDEQREAEEHPVEWNVAPAAGEDEERERDRRVREGDETVGDGVEPDEAGRPEVAMSVRHEARGEEVLEEARPRHVSTLVPTAAKHSRMDARISVKLVKNSDSGGRYGAVVSHATRERRHDARGRSQHPRGGRTHADRQAAEGGAPRRRRDLRQVRVPEPGRLDEGPGGAATSSPTPSGAGCSGRAARSSRRPAATPAWAWRWWRRCAATPASSSCPTRCRRRRSPALRAFGAQVVICPTAVEPEDPRSYYQTAKRIVAGDAGRVLRQPVPQPGQPRGALHLDGARDLGADRRRGRRLRAPAWAPAGRSRAAARYFKEKKPGFQLVGVDPIGSLYYEYVKTGRHDPAVRLLRRGDRRGLPARAR